MIGQLRHQLTARKMLSLFGKESTHYQTFIRMLRDSPRVVASIHELFQNFTDESWNDVDEKEGLTLAKSNDVYLFVLLWMIGGRLLLEKERASLEHAFEVFHRYMKRMLLLPMSSDFMDWLQDKTWSILEEMYDVVSQHRLPKHQDLFHLLHQQLMSSSLRKTLGAYFTPPNLAQLMVSELLINHRQNVLDPACGTGIFLVEAFNRLFQLCGNNGDDGVMDVIQRIHGFDLHPNATVAATINLLVQLQDVMDDLSRVKLSIYQRDALSLQEKARDQVRFRQTFDVVIGNPPWRVLNSFKSREIKEQLKTLAKEFHVLPPSHQVSHLELSALFLEAAKRWYLKPNGRLFMVMSHSLLSGDNHCRTRRFDELDDVEIWTFKENVFPIPFCCVKARYAPGNVRSSRDLKSFAVKLVSHETIEKALQSKSHGHKWETRELVPAFVDQDHGTLRVGRFIPLNVRRALLPRGKNPYHSRCFAGATLFPRNLIFVTIKEQLDNGLVQACPQIKNAKKPWHFNPLESSGEDCFVFEKEYQFPVITSKEILPFATLSPRMAFLPIEIDLHQGGYKKMENARSVAWKHYLHLEEAYSRHRKPNSLFSTLWDRLNYQHCLTAPRQRARIRVLMPQSGQIVKAALLQNPDVIVDYTSYLIPCRNVEEAHYLVGILNSPLMNKTMKVLKADRHVQKRPFEWFFPEFDPNNLDHEEIAELSEKMHVNAVTFVRNLLKKEPFIGRISLQRRLLNALEDEFSQLNDMVTRVLVGHS